MRLSVAALLPLVAATVIVEEDHHDHAPLISYHQGLAQTACPGTSTCVTLESCKLIVQLMDRTCLAAEKLRELTCGYKGIEPMICCPQGGFDGIHPIAPTYPPTAKPPTHPSHPGGSNGKQCGQSIVKSAGGGLGTQPWVAQIGFVNTGTGSLTFPCLGSIISSRTILTAAHCALAKATNHKISKVRIGEYDTSTDPDCTYTHCAHNVQDIPINYTVVHPGYEKKTFKHNVALIMLKHPITFTMTAQPICLLQGQTVPLVGRKGFLVGWGKIPGDADFPTHQRQLELPVINLDTCKNLYHSVVPVTNDNLCVGADSKHDACTGWGGAPLIMLEHITQSRYYQVGMVSFGSDKCGGGDPSVFTNIREYYSWIKYNMLS